MSAAWTGEGCRQLVQRDHEHTLTFHSPRAEMALEKAALNTYLCGKVVVEQAEEHETACNPAIVKSLSCTDDLRVWWLGRLERYRSGPEDLKKQGYRYGSGGWSAVIVEDNVCAGLGYLGG